VADGDAADLVRLAAMSFSLAFPRLPVSALPTRAEANSRFDLFASGLS
jgi:hypothetical protein